MFHILCYEEDVTAGSTDENLDAIDDDGIITRDVNTASYIFTEPYQLLGAAGLGTTMTDARMDVPSWNGVGHHHIWPFERSATVPDNPNWQDLRMYRPQLPMNEAIGIQSSNALACGTEKATVFLWIAPPNWSRQLPPGLLRLTLQATVAVTGVDDAWSALGAFTFEDRLRAGWYSVVGLETFEASVLASRINFARTFTDVKRHLRPGILNQNALGAIPQRGINGEMGVWGSFHSFEPPTMQIYQDAAVGAVTVDVRLDVIYHGDQKPANVI